MAKNQKSGLGRDFTSLFDDNQIGTDNAPAVMLRLSDIEPNREQPRKSFDEDELASLAASISSLGLLQPIIVTANIDYPGTYRIIAGERRWRACRLAGLSEVPCIVFSGDDMTKAEISLVENIQRKDLNPIEEAMGMRDLMEKFGLTQDEVAQKTGRSRPAVANTLRLLDLPDEVLKMVTSGDLSAGHARTLLGIKNPDMIPVLAKKIIETEMSVRDAEQAVKIINRPEKEQPVKPRNEQLDVYIKELERRSMELSGHRMRISDKGEGKRQLIIDYSGNDDLEQLLVKICGDSVIPQ